MSQQRCKFIRQIYNLEMQYKSMCLYTSTSTKPPALRSMSHKFHTRVDMVTYLKQNLTPMIDIGWFLDLSLYDTMIYCIMLYLHF